MQKVGSYFLCNIIRELLILVDFPVCIPILKEITCETKTLWRQSALDLRVLCVF